MSLSGFQQALSELVLSSELRSRVEDLGPEALGDFDLDAREKRRLLAIAGQAGLKTGILIHRSFRLSMLTRSLPRTCRLLGSRLSDRVHDYWDDHLPLHFNYVWEACRFADHLRGLVRSGVLEEPLLVDALRIDLACTALERGLAPDQVELDPRPGGNDLAAKPAPGRWVLVCGHEPKALLAALQAPGSPTPPVGDYRLSVSRRPNGSLHVEPA